MKDKQVEWIYDRGDMIDDGVDPFKYPHFPMMDARQ